MKTFSLYLTSSPGLFLDYLPLWPLFVRQGISRSRWLFPLRFSRPYLGPRTWFFPFLFRSCNLCKDFLQDSFVNSPRFPALYLPLSFRDSSSVHFPATNPLCLQREHGVAWICVSILIGRCICLILPYVEEPMVEIYSLFLRVPCQKFFWYGSVVGISVSFLPLLGLR